MPDDLLPTVSYRPPDPNDPPGIALVGCGGVTSNHLTAYTTAGWDVVALCDIEEDAARERRDEFYPEADVTTDVSAVYEREDVAVVDIATRPETRVDLIADALRAGKHVLSQKPFVLDLDTGERLVDIADEHDVRLAVNQNGRWAPHWSYVRNAAAEGLIGKLLSAHLHASWDHDRITRERFDDARHSILCDYAIHYFDLLACLFPHRDPNHVSATVARSPTQTASPPLLGQAIVDYDGAQASLSFDGNVPYGTADRTTVGGTDGTLHCDGPSLNDQNVSLHGPDGHVAPDLEGSWFPTGFRGSMAELLCAVEADREPTNSARDNLRSLALCFAAVAAAEDGESKVPGEVRELRQGDPADLVPA